MPSLLGISLAPFFLVLQIQVTDMFFMVLDELNSISICDECKKARTPPSGNAGLN